MAIDDSDTALGSTPRWRRRRGLSRYREFVLFGVLLGLIVVFSVVERLDPSDVAESGTFIDTPSGEWIVLLSSALLAELTVCFAAVKTLVFVGRDRGEAWLRALLTVAAAALLVLVVWAAWPREHIYTREGFFRSYEDPPLLGFLVAESRVERQLKALPAPDDGVDAWTVFEAFARHGGRPGIRGALPGEPSFEIYRYGEAPLDIVVQIAPTPAEAWHTPRQFASAVGAGCPAGEQPHGTPSVVTRGNVAVLLRAPCPRSPVSDLGAERALVQDVLDSLD